jgi:hypothetical protein
MQSRLIFGLRGQSNLAILDYDKRRAFRATLADMSALEIAAKHDVRSLVQDGGLVNMHERPIVVALVDQVLDGARRKVDMPPLPPSPVCRTPILKQPAIGDG